MTVRTASTSPHIVTDASKANSILMPQTLSQFRIVLSLSS